MRNERFRLLATLLNTMANASYTVGVAAPIAAGVFYGQTIITLHAIEIGVMVWAGVAIMLHGLAQLALWGVR
jgi:hypothetical protein